MSIPKVSNIFSQSELDFFTQKINSLVTPLHKDGSYVYDESSDVSVSRYLGRIQTGTLFIEIPTSIREKLTKIANDNLDFKNDLSQITYVEYNSLYGIPDLPPHFDGDNNDLIINCQLFSNTSWPIGIGTKTYDLEDNSALVFNGNTNIHWRPHKNFKPGEYVKMIFVRFCNSKNLSDYSDRIYSQDHDVFKEIRSIRDSSPTGT